MGTDSSTTSNDNNEIVYRRRIVWFNVFVLTIMHLSAVYGVYLLFTSARLYTTLYTVLLYHLGIIGITAGAHRLWSHRAYKAKWQLQVILMILDTLAFEGHVIDWARNHRLHHKCSETDADPHNVKRGVFFSHIGWLLCRKHPQVLIKGKGLNILDLEENSILAFQKKYYYILLMPLICFILPTLLPVYLWNETWENAIFVSMIFRYVLTLNVTFSVNSIAHRYGARPYEKSIGPAENKLVSILTSGEGWHNYHHVFPWDYKTAELGNYKYNLTTAYIDFFAWLGWAYELRTVSDHPIKIRALRTGDGSHNVSEKYDNN